VNSLARRFKLINQLKFVPQFGMMWDTLERSASGCASFLVIFFVFFFAFAQAFCVVFHSRVPAFRTIGQTNYALMEALLGDFDFESLQAADGYMGPVLFVMFICLAVFVVLNTLIAIISDAYSEAQEHAKTLPPVHLIEEVVDYLVNRLETYVPGGKAVLGCMSWGARWCKKSVVPQELLDGAHEHDRRASSAFGDLQTSQSKPEGLSNEELSEQMFTLQMSVRTMLTALEDDLAQNKTASLETEVNELKQVVKGMAKVQSGNVNRQGNELAEIHKRVASVEATPIVEHHRRIQATSIRPAQRVVQGPSFNKFSGGGRGGLNA
jgi:hypothetical protein